MTRKMPRRSVPLLMREEVMLANAEAAADEYVADSLVARSPTSRSDHKHIAQRYRDMSYEYRARGQEYLADGLARMAEAHVVAARRQP